MKNIAGILVLLVICSSCVGKASDSRYLSYEQASNNLHVHEVIASGIDGFIYTVARNRNSTFYTVAYDEFNPFVNQMSIYQTKGDNTSPKLIFEYKDEKKIFISEILANDDFLCWVIIEEDGVNWEIQKMNLKSGTVESISNYESSTSITFPVIELSDEYLFWYELLNEDDIYNNNILMKHNLKEDITEIASKNVYRSGGFNRPEYSDGKVLFLKKDYAGSINFHVLDVRTEEEKVYNSDFESIVDYAYSNDHIIFRLDYKESQVYLYSFENDQLMLLDQNIGIKTIYDIGFVHGIPWIAYGRDSNNQSNLYLYNFFRGESICITENSSNVTYVSFINYGEGDLFFNYRDDNGVIVCTLVPILSNSE